MGKTGLRIAVRNLLKNTDECLRQYALTIGNDLAKLEAFRSSNALSKVEKRDLKRLSSDIETIIADIGHSMDFLEITLNCYSDDRIIDLLEAIDEKYTTQ